MPNETNYFQPGVVTEDQCIQEARAFLAPNSSKFQIGFDANHNPINTVTEAEIARVHEIFSISYTAINNKLYVYDYINYGNDASPIILPFSFLKTERTVLAYHVKTNAVYHQNEWGKTCAFFQDTEAAWNDVFNFAQTRLQDQSNGTWLPRKVYKDSLLRHCALRIDDRIFFLSGSGKCASGTFGRVKNAVLSASSDAPLYGIKILHKSVLRYP